ncbi:hypothetical protein SLEP1_g52855 [Rubroshorea leprosula]|uniref:Uncharacterized protein n=1 Tax=Rubroshorea leprosula TaxID=152421 RepID=A0AAV5M8D7_9ROSI|nr:hypothetical protein SLEP1_g52855 [Rubroshorea leprosula]
MIMRLWEVLWTHYLSERLHLYVCCNFEAPSQQDTGRANGLRHPFEIH